MRTKRVCVVPYDAAWKHEFLKIKEELVSAIGAHVLAAEHVGSTAVEGLPSKPCIDIDVVIKDASMLPEVVRGLAAIGYEHEGDLGIKGREAFRYSDKPHLFAHHLYVCAQDSEELYRHLTFRDFLKNHPEAAKDYGRAKEEAARLYPDDIEKYMEYKAPCIEALNRLCGLEK